MPPPFIPWPDEQGGNTASGYPSPADVRAGVVFGANGEFVGTMLQTLDQVSIVMSDDQITIDVEDAA